MSAHGSAAETPMIARAEQDDWQVLARGTRRETPEWGPESVDQANPLRLLLRADTANCTRGDVDPDAWFTESINTNAQLACLTCPLREACGEYGQSEGLSGLWGGVQLRDGHPTMQRRSRPQRARRAVR